MKLNERIMRMLDWPGQQIERLRDWLEEGHHAIYDPPRETNPLGKRRYVMSEKHLSGHRLIVGFESAADCDAAHDFVLAQQRAQPAQGVPDGWLRAIDEALVTAHIGVANAHDTYEQAKAKLDSLIGFHVDVATDPAVNGGWKLMPVEPTREIYECFAAYDGTSYSNPFDCDDFIDDYRLALEVAPEAKP